MKKFFKNYWLLILIAILALTLRVYKLDEYPVGLTWDEPALGYNAYSILKTGKDEYGNFLPITFKSFGDNKPGLFIYVQVPFIALLGLNTFAVRLPSALAGVGTVVAIYFLVKYLLDKSRKFTYLPYLASLLLAISPWSIHFSRGAWEANFALFTIVLGSVFFLKAFSSEKNKFFILSFIFYAASFYVYHGAKVFLVVFLGGSLFLLHKKIQNFSVKTKWIGLALLLLLLFPLFASFKGSANRARVMSIFSYTRNALEISSIKNRENELTDVNFLLYHSESLNTLRGIAGRYFNHFSGKFLFFEGDWTSPRHSTPYTGMLYLIEIPFLLLGVAYFISLKKKLEENLLLWWLLVGPIPAAVTRDSIQGTRSYWMVIPLIIFIALGIYIFLSWLMKRSKVIFCGGIVFLAIGYLFFIYFYLDLYYVHFPKKNSAGWNYGVEEIVKIIAENKNKYSRILVTPEYGQPYIFYLFYTKYPPSDYQKQAFLKEDPNGDVGTVGKIDNIEFKNSYWPEDRSCQNCLVIDNEFALTKSDIENTPGARILKDVKFLDGRIAYRVVETK